MAVFRAGDMEIAFDDTGPRGARAVVLVHGFATDRRENWQRLGWTGACERRGFRTVCFDCRGHGESGKPVDSKAYSRESMIGDLFATMDHLGIASADLLGYSMGARIALAAALEKPERVDRLVLGGVGARLFEPPRSSEKMAEAMEAEDPETVDDPLLRSFRYFAEESHSSRLSLIALLRSDIRFVAGADAAAELRTLDRPVLVVAGARDDLAGDPEPLARAFPRGRAVTLPGCDHFSAIPHGLFKAAAFDFLDDALE